MSMSFFNADDRAFAARDFSLLSAFDNLASGAESNLLMERVDVWLPFKISPAFPAVILDVVNIEKDRIVLTRVRIIQNLHMFVMKI